MTDPSSHEQPPEDAGAAAPDHNDRIAGPDRNDLNWQALAEPTGRRPMLWQAMRWIAVLATITLLTAVVVHVAWSAMRGG